MLKATLVKMAFAYAAGVQRKEIREGIPALHQAMAGSDLGDDHSFTFLALRHQVIQGFSIMNWF